MPRLLHVVGQGQGTDPPPKRRRGPSPSLSLTPDEVRAVRAFAKNVARVHFGTLTKLAQALGIHPGILTSKHPPGAGLAVALARISGQSVDAVLGWKGLALALAPLKAPAPEGGAA